MTWAQRLKRVFQIDFEQCSCGGKIRIIASIEDPPTIRRILDHLDRRARGSPTLTIEPQVT